MYVNHKTKRKVWEKCGKFLNRITSSSILTDVTGFIIYVLFS